jgi:hypothetical protein
MKVEGADTYQCWRRNEITGGDEPFQMKFNWDTRAWIIDGVVWPAGASPGSGRSGFAINHTGNPHRVESRTFGKVTVQLQYQGAAPIPKLVDVHLSGSSGFGHTAGGSGTTENGVGGEYVTEDYFGRISTRHTCNKIRTFEVDSATGTAQFDYQPQGESSADGIDSNCGVAPMWASIRKVDRRVSIMSLSFPAQRQAWYQGTQSIGKVIVDWDGTKELKYYEAIPVPQKVDYTARGEVTESTVAIPFSEVPTSSAPGDPESAVFFKNIFQGIVGGIDRGTARYSSRASSSINIPHGFLWQDWSVPINEFSMLGAYTRHYGTYSQHIPGDVDKRESTQFTYTWESDGATGDALVRQTFKYPCDRSLPYGTHEEVREPENPLTVIPGNDSPYERVGQWQKLLTIDGKFVDYRNDNGTLSWDAVNGVFSVANYTRKHGRLLKPLKPLLDVAKQKVAATWAGFIPDLADVLVIYLEPEKFDLSRQLIYFRKAYLLGDIKPRPRSSPFNLSDSAATAVMEEYDWCEKRRQLYNIEYYADNIYDSSGFVGLSLGDKVSPSQRFDRRQLFQKGKDLNEFNQP